MKRFFFFFSNCPKAKGGVLMKRFDFHLLKYEKKNETKTITENGKNIA